VPRRCRWIGNRSGAAGHTNGDIITDQRYGTRPGIDGKRFAGTVDIESANGRGDGAIDRGDGGIATDCGVPALFERRTLPLPALMVRSLLKVLAAPLASVMPPVVAVELSVALP